MLQTSDRGWELTVKAEILLCLHRRNVRVITWKRCICSSGYIWLQAGPLNSIIYSNLPNTPSAAATATIWGERLKSMPPYSYITLSIVWINIIFHLFLHLVLRNIAVISVCKVILYAWYPTNRPQIALQHRVRVWVSEMSNNSKFDFILSTLSIQNVDQSTKTKHCLVVPLAV